MRIRVHVVPRKGVLDPQGQAVAEGLRHLGFGEVQDVRVGKVIDLKLDGVEGRDQALNRARQMAEQLLANEVIEDFTIDLVD